MKILFICDEYPPGKTGGIGSVTKLLADTLCKNGHQVFVAGIYAHGYGGKDYEEQNGVRIWRLRYKTDVGLISGNDTLKDKLIVHALRKTGILTTDAANRLKELIHLINDLIEKHGIDIIEMPDWNNFYFNIHLKDLKIPDLKIPLTVKMHGTLSYFNQEQHLPVRESMYAKERSVFERADTISSVSLYTANICKDLYHLKKPVKVLHNGVEVKGYVETEKRRNLHSVIFTGSLFYKKGIFSLIKAWKDVLKEIPDATLHVFGKGDQSALLSLLDEKEKPKVIFHGHVKREHVLKELELADLAVFPSYSETFGLGVVEAMSLGCPAIYTKRSCGPEILENHKEGLLVDPDNLKEISDSIVLLLKNAALRKEMSLAAYKKVKEKFDIDFIASEHVGFYRQVISEHSPAQR